MANYNGKIVFFSLMTALAFSLGACSNAKEKLGLNKSAPDEFQVVRRAPLAMPPDYALRPPQPGAQRPQERSTVDQARQTVFGAQASGNAAAAPTNAGEAFLREAGAQLADPGIRTKVDMETQALGDKNKPVIKKIMSIGRDTAPSASVVNAPKEAERLKNNAAQKQPPTSGETPTVVE
ncbi:MAG: DUF3035 domain-containing protein [Alphaproteobacteria bacterium]|nr:DUF3035 domain-containing protein [Alphaproteobacteria bacterium]